MLNKWTSLHTHSEGSLIDGLGTVERLVDNAVEKGFDHIALTEHGTLSTAVTFALTCEDRGIKPILGLEGYITVDGERGHITLLADGEKGFQSLVDLNNLGHKRAGSKPAFTVQDLESHSDGLVLLTGCIVSPLQSMPLGEAVRLGARLKAAFGHKMFAEMMFVEDTNEHFERALKLSEKLGIKTVITNDVHFAKEEDADIHPLLTKMKAAYEYNSEELWLKTYGQMLGRAMPIVGRAKAEKALERSYKIGELIKPVDFKRPISLPDIPGVELPDARLANIAKIGLIKKGLHREPKYRKRIDEELRVIRNMGFSKYFLILEDIVNDARNMGALIGPGRGSGVGSLVLYAMDITGINPVEHGLEFERFLNPHRAEFPDVDLDFDSDTRDELLEEVADKWDASQIATYSRYTHKILTKDLAKVLGFNPDEAQEAADNGRLSLAFKRLEKQDERFGQAYDAIYGQTRHRGKHAGGIVITDHKLPLERVGDKLVAAWTEGQSRELTKVGVVKFDLLGLTALSELKYMAKKSGFPVEDIPEHDALVYEKVFKNGNVSGIFQFSGSPGIVDMTKDIQPENLSDLTAINALYRPGPLDAGTAEHYVEWRNNPRKLHPLIDDILEDTYGVIVYQEQVMHIIQTIMGGSMGEADIARRLFSKPKFGNPEWEKKIDRLEKRFFREGSKKLDTKLLEKLWEELVAHSRYSFNKSHATAYSQIAYWQGFYKSRFPEIFYAAKLNYDSDDSQEYIFDAIRQGLKVRPPHVNISGFQWEPAHGQIYMPLNAVKWLGEKGGQAIVSARDEIKKGSGFESLEQYMESVPKRAVNSRARKGLWAIGAFEGIPSQAGGKPTEVLEIPDVTVYSEDIENQKEYLGFVLPTKKLLDDIELYRSQYKAGIITGKKKKVSNYGPYEVYYLMPNDSFWARPALDLEVGDIVYARVTDYGKALKVNFIS